MMKLTREVLWQEYVVDKLTSYEIAAKYGCSAAWVNVLRQEYGIRALLPWERNKQQVLSQIQTEYIYGSLLGDDCLKRNRVTDNAYLKVSHAESQKEYVKFKYDIMHGFVMTDIKVHHDRRPDRQNQFAFHTISHPVFTNLYEEIYPSQKKTISAEWLERLTPFSLAIWYMDDGSLTQSNKHMRISTEAFTYREQSLVQTFLANKWNIHPTIKSSPAEGKWLLNFEAKERDKLFDLISPFMIDCMRYKLYYRKET